MKQKTAMQELIDICNKDQVSFTEWFLNNYQTFLEKEKEQIIDAYWNGNSDGFVDKDFHNDYYEKTYKQD